MKATGIGGFIFRAKGPEALTSWYRENLGIDRIKWQQQAGPTAFAPMSEDSDYFGSKSQQFMLNFRVDDLDGILKQLRADNIKIVKDIQQQAGIGRFARIEDPEGNPIELWEPQAE